MIETIDLAVCAIFTKGREDFGPGVSDLPAWPFGIKISRTVLADIFRTNHYLPAGILAFPEI